MGTTVIERAGALTLDDVIKIRRERIRTQDYDALGQAVWIVPEAAAGVDIPEAQRVGLRLDFLGEGPMLGRSRDGRDLLICNPIVRSSDRKVGLPDIRDPNWQPKQFTQEEIESADFKWPEHPMAKQSLQARGGRPYTDGGGATWLIIQPIVQIIYRPVGVASYGTISCDKAPWDNTFMALMVNTQDGEAHLVGGRFNVGLVIRGM